MQPEITTGASAFVSLMGEETEKAINGLDVFGTASEQFGSSSVPNLLSFT